MQSHVSNLEISSSFRVNKNIIIIIILLYLYSALYGRYNMRENRKIDKNMPQ